MFVCAFDVRVARIGPREELFELRERDCGAEAIIRKGRSSFKSKAAAP